MMKWKALAGMSLTVAIAALVALYAPQKGVSASNGPATLTALDYIEIQKLVASYPFALDTGAEKGYMYADLFTVDGVFSANTAKPYEVKGREKLAALAWQHRPGQGPSYVRNYDTNVVVNATSEGASGRSYAVMMNIGEAGKPNTVVEGGHYEDTYVKTPQGWRIKRREFFPAKFGS
jgi:hypothetical protein